MYFLLSAKLMNKVLLTSPILNSYSGKGQLPGQIKRLNITAWYLAKYLFNQLFRGIISASFSFFVNSRVNRKTA